MTEIRYVAYTLIILCFTVRSIVHGGYRSQMIESVSNSEVIGDDQFFEIIEPSELEYTYRIRPAKDFGAPFNGSICMKKTKLVPMDPIEGCVIPENKEKIEGNVAFVSRGECSFVQKTVIAEQAGARAIIITEMEFDEPWDTTPDQFIEMIDDRSDRDADIPAAFLLGRSGVHILQTLQRLHRSYATINFPINMTYTPMHRMNQPPWISW